MFDFLQCLTRPLHRRAIALTTDLVDLVTPLVRRVTIALTRNSDTAKIACGEDQCACARGELANGPQVLSPCARHELAIRVSCETSPSRTALLG
ncbi:unnamed protein product [Nippostrongylus brasiliensis]|uniref:Secreted protein n=1 Tax=Nippostrongylus brasiliensis TaxID=27835 RepID=A0A0N4XKU5_NIPBR|nr:unnamed protein product [Nippostrongylus brasiliensis]